MDLKTELLAQAQSHCETHKISLARLSTIVVNDGKFFDRLAKGGGFTVSTFQKFQKYFAASAVSGEAA